MKIEAGKRTFAGFPINIIYESASRKIKTPTFAQNFSPSDAGRKNNQTIFMKTKVIVLGGLAAASMFSSCDKMGGAATATASLKTNIDSVSYSIGADMGRNILMNYDQIKQQNIKDINKEAFLQGIKDMMMGDSSKALISEADAKTVMQKFSEQMRFKQLEEMRVQSEANTAAGKTFLEENKKRTGVKEVEGGLQYEVLTEGKGAKPALTDQVTVHYTGTLIDGTVFDSSMDRGEPATFPVNGVIQGWQKLIPMMPQGAKWKLFIPGEMAYGPQGAGPDSKIGPNATLIFEVELLKINGK